MAVSERSLAPTVSRWEFRFYQTVDGKRKLKVQTVHSVTCPTETAVRKAVEGQLGALNSGTLAGKVAAALAP